MTVSKSTNPLDDTNIFIPIENSPTIISRTPTPSDFLLVCKECNFITDDSESIQCDCCEKYICFGCKNKMIKSKTEKGFMICKNCYDNLENIT